MKQQLTLPGAVFLLEEANLSADLAQSLAGLSVVVEVLPEEPPATRRVEPDDYPLLIDPDGNYWNDYRPTRVLFTDAEGRIWRLPRGWLAMAYREHQADWNYSGPEGIALIEEVNLPSFWDLLEINIPEPEAMGAGGKPTTAQIHVSPNKPMKVLWRDSEGHLWQIPHDWRRRRIKLPAYDELVSQGIPNDVAKNFAHRAVSVNYHPGSLCCLPEQYRFRDEDGNRWPVYIRNCVLLGYGDAAEYQA